MFLFKRMFLLERMSEDPNETHDTRGDASTLHQNILNFNFLVFMYFWFEVLTKIDRVQKRLQDPKMDFHESYLDIESLQMDIARKRDNICSESVTKAKNKCDLWGVAVERRVRRRRRMPGELAQDEGLSAEQEAVRIMKSALDRLNQEMTTRFTRLKDLDLKFGFLLNIDGLLRMEDSDGDILCQHCDNFARFYDLDVNGTELFNEIYDCRMLLQTRQDEVPTKPLELLSFIVSYGEDVFPNLRVALQILLTIAVSIASCERSFSKLKLILSYLRASMGEDRLSDLALMSVERDVLEQVDFDEIIDQFAAVKARKVHLV